MHIHDFHATGRHYLDISLYKPKANIYSPRIAFLWKRKTNIIAE